MILNKLNISKVQFTQLVRAHSPASHFEGELCGNSPCNVELTNGMYEVVNYIVDLESKTCTGDVGSSGVVLVNEEWWKEHCARIAEKICARFESFTLEKF